MLSEASPVWPHSQPLHDFFGTDLHWLLARNKHSDARAHQLLEVAVRGDDEALHSARTSYCRQAAEHIVGLKALG
jgi:hypothetical protein